MTFSERMQELVNKGIAASREILEKAGGQAQTWGEMGVLRIEILQFRRQAERQTARLGALAYAALAERGEASLKADSPEVAELIARIRELDRTIEEKEKRFRELGGKDGDLEEDKPAS